MARLYANENFPLPVVERLRQLGHDVLTTTDAGKHDRALADQEVLSFAISEARAILTLKRKHFIHLHAEQAEHRGIIVCTFDPNFSGQAERIHDAIASAQSLDRQLIRVNRPQN